MTPHEQAREVTSPRADTMTRSREYLVVGRKCSNKPLGERKQMMVEEMEEYLTPTREWKGQKTPETWKAAQNLLDHLYVKEGKQRGQTWGMDMGSAATGTQKM